LAPTVCPGVSLGHRFSPPAICKIEEKNREKFIEKISTCILELTTPVPNLYGTIGAGIINSDIEANQDRPTARSEFLNKT
jgi:hypothetical protein